MKVSMQNEVRAKYIEAAMRAFQDEDIGMIASNSFNFPIVVDGEEAWIEIVVKIPKSEDGYEKREDYQLKQAAAAEKAAAKAKADAAKAAKAEPAE